MVRIVGFEDQLKIGKILLRHRQKLPLYLNMKIIKEGKFLFIIKCFIIRKMTGFKLVGMSSMAKIT